MVQRRKYLKTIEMHFQVHPACAILGPRQVGKTTLAKMFLEEQDSPEAFHFFDLENPIDLARFENPMLTLSKLSNKLIVIDEIQRAPELFPVLRVLIDDKEKKQKFLILGSASRDLIRQSSESLAGRIGYMELMPFSLDEVDHDSEILWLRGGFPRSYLAKTDEDSFLWRQSYIATFLERDIPNLGFQIPPQQMRRFWLMLVHYHGQIFNASELGKSLGISDHMVRKYLDILAGTFMVRILLPWYENLEKRQIKSPKIYFRDSGILHALIGIHNQAEMDIYPKMGSFWEGFALEEIIRQTGASSEECYFWGTQSNAELDLLILKNGKRIGYEFKYSDAPKITPSMRIACQDLKLDHLYVVYPGKETFSLSEKITARGLQQ
ncbi:MAG TPA: ATP-binding protein [Rhabdochlamydiaceae bacterium]|nr:ATP-binding protein [Rhabdochlamydiaceae bacterium]